MSEPSIRHVLILEDQPEAFQLMQRVVSNVLPTAEVTHAASLEALASITMDSIQLFLVDLRLPDGLSCDYLQTFKQQHPDIPAIVTTLYDENDLVFSALKAGADGYLLKGDGEERLIQGLKRLLSGEPPISPAIARKLMRSFDIPKSETASTTPAPEQSMVVADARPEIRTLTPRETEVLVLIAKGKMTKQVASELSLSIHTINDVIKSIYKKLGIRSRAQATLEASKSGLI